MAKLVDSCCVPSSMTVQLTKPDKNNNTTANIDDGIILPSENCDVIEDGTDEKYESTGDSDDHHHSSGGDDDGQIIDNTATTETIDNVASSSSSNDENDLSINNGTTMNNDNNNNTNTSTNTVSTPVPYKDFSGVDTESFITTTLRNNPKDRTLLLTLESVFQQFIQDDEQKSHQFQAMNSYERMIVHRVAAFFGLDHNVDKNGQAVVVTKTPNTRIPHFSFQKCIPEDESTDITSGGASTTTTTENPISLTNPTEIPTRRILRRHDKNPNHEHSQRNGLNDEYTNQQISSTNKNQPLSKPYSERVNNYAETRARIFNENADMTNSSITNKNVKNNQKQHSNFARPSYRKQQQQQQHQNSSQQQQRSYTYQHSQQTTNNHIQQYPTAKTIDPSSHMLNTSTTRAASIYSTQQPPSGNLTIPQPQPIYASMVGSNPGTTSLRPPGATSFYTQPQQQPIEYDYKQQASGAHIYNYLPMIPSTTSSYIHQQQQQQAQQLHSQPTSATAAAAAVAAGPNQVPNQHGAGIPLPILVHQQPTGQIQYLFPAHPLQQQAAQAPPPNNPYSITPDGQYVQLYRPDTLSIPGPPTVPPPTVVDNNHNHHHPYSQNQPHHHHHPIAQQTQQQQVQQSQSNLAPQPPPFVRIYPAGTPGNVSHPYGQASYQPPPPSQATFVQPGTIPAPSYMIPPPQNTGNVQTYATFDNGVSYNAYGPATSAVTTPGKQNINNNGASVQYLANHLSTLNLQSQHDEYQTRVMNNQQSRFTHSNGSTGNNQQRNFMGRPLVQSPNGSTVTPRMTIYSTSNQTYRQTRPFNISNTDKQLTSIENDPKSLAQQQNNCDNNSLAGPAQD